MTLSYIYGCGILSGFIGIPKCASLVFTLSFLTVRYNIWSYVNSILIGFFLEYIISGSIRPNSWFEYNGFEYFI